MYHTVHTPRVIPPKPEPRILSPKRSMAEDAVLCNIAMRRCPTSPQGGKSADRLAAERHAIQAVILAALSHPSTVNDICARTGMGYDRTLHHLNNMLKAGKVTRNGGRPHVWEGAK